MLRGEGSLCLEWEDVSSVYEEQEANEFAAGTLVPPEHMPLLMTLDANTRNVTRFATRIGLAPGVVVGQLQRLDRIGPNQLNGLKRRYRWEGGTLASRERV